MRKYENLNYISENREPQRAYYIGSLSIVGVKKVKTEF